MPKLTRANDPLVHLTCASGLDADWLEASVESRGIDDVRVEVAMVLAVHEERHDDGDDQAHDYGNDNPHIQSHVVCARGGCGGKKNRRNEKQEMNEEQEKNREVSEALNWKAMDIKNESSLIDSTFIKTVSN